MEFPPVAAHRSKAQKGVLLVVLMGLEQISPSWKTSAKDVESCWQAARDGMVETLSV